MGVGSGSDVGSGMFVSDGVTSSSVFAGLSSLSGVLQLVISTMKVRWLSLHIIFSSGTVILFG